MLVYLSDGSAQAIVRAATLRYKLQVKLSASSHHSKLTPDQPIPALTLQFQTPGSEPRGAPILKSTV